jgi:hypothetical protein
MLHFRDMNYDVLLKHRPGIEDLNSFEETVVPVRYHSVKKKIRVTYRTVR